MLSHLRSRPATADIPVVVLTATGDEDDEVRVFRLGATDFLTKPFRARALSARLDAVVGRRRSPPSAVTEIRVAIVDVYVLRPAAGGWEALCLRRAPDERSAGTWETVHGHIEDGERPTDAAVRELREETGLDGRRASTTRAASRASTCTARTCSRSSPSSAPSWRRGRRRGCRTNTIACEWLPAERAAERFGWPRERRALADVLALLGRGDAGGFEDVLRV